MTIKQTIRARFTGQPATDPSRYQILFIHEGQANGYTFSRQVLQESAQLWEQASVFVDHSFWGQSVRDLGGVLSGAAWSDEFAGLTAELTPAGPSKDIITECARVMLGDGPHPDIGFSVDMVFTADAQKNVQKIIQPFSVDLVIDPAFATKFIRQLEQQKGATMAPQETIPPKAEPAPITAEDLKRIAHIHLDTALERSGLSDKAQDHIRHQFEYLNVFGPSEINRAIQSYKDAVAAETAAQEIKGPARVSGMFTADDQIQAAIDDLCGAPREPGAENLKVHRIGLKEAYAKMTGDLDMVGGFFRDRVQFQHTTSSFPGLVANALNKALMNQWAQLGRAGYDWWTKITRVEHFDSLQDIAWLIFGTVASLPEVSEGAEYTELSIGDNKETSSFVKYGGYIGLTLEAIDKDDGRKLRAIPQELANAGLRNISALVAAIFTANTAVGPTLADGGALFNNTAVTSKTGHANLLTTALGTDFTAWDAVAQAVYNQPLLVANPNSAGAYGSGKKMAVEPRFILVPRALKAAAEALFIPRWGPVNMGVTVPTSGGPTYAGFVEPITVPEWTDANDWAAVVDPAIVPGIMIGERWGLVPQIFVAGSETDPAMFANDEQRIKVRHAIAVGVCDFRPLHKSNV